MKGTYLMAILYVATLSVVAFEILLEDDIPTKCPSIDPENTTIHLAHETDCTKYYRCHKGQKGKPLDCPFMDNKGNRLHFNPKLQVCDWPWNAGCQITTSTSSTSTTIASTSSTSFPTLPTSPNTSTSSTTPNITTSSTLPSSSSTSPISSSTTTSSISSTSSPTSTTSPNTSTPSTTQNITTSSTSPSSSSTSSISSSTTTAPTSSTSSPTSPTSPNTLTSSTTPNIITSSTSPSSSSTSPISSSTTTASTSSTSSPTSPTSPSSSSITSPIPLNTTVAFTSSPCISTPSTTSNTTTLSTSPSSSSTSLVPPSTVTSSTLPNTSTSSTMPSTTTSSTSSSTSSAPPSTLTWPISPNISTSSSNPILRTCKFDGKLHLLPHEIMCDHYYYCFNGKVNPVPQKCDRNLLLNPKLRICDYPENVICITGTILPSIIATPFTTLQLNTTTLLPTIMMPMQLIIPLPSPSQTGLSFPIFKTCRSHEITRIAHSSQCNLYYDCVDGKKLLQICPMGKHFDYARKICDSIVVVNCFRPYPTSDNVICPPPGSTRRIRLPHECECTQYYECINGKKVLRYCSKDLHFDRRRQKCTNPSEADCDITSTPSTDTTTDTTTNTPTIPEVCPPPGSTRKVFLPHECKCTQYYECINGKKALRYCSKDLHFDRRRQKCTDPSEADCNVTSTPSTDTTTDTTTNTPTIPEICPPPGSTRKVFLPHECKCTQYYECINGKKVLRYCSKDLHFDRRRQKCTDPSEADCDVTSIPSTDTTTDTTTTGSTTKSSTTQSSTTQSSTAKSSTTQSSTTKSSTTQSSTTQSSTTQNSTTQSSTTQSSTTQSSTTKSSTITTTEGTITTRDPNNPRKECPSKRSNEIGRILHPYQCNLYYDCVNGEKELRTCPIGKHFDYVREVCDWASVVNCIRPVPTFNPVIDSENLENNLISFNDKNNDKRQILDNLDPSNCIGTCPEEDPEFAVLLPNDDCKKFCLCSNGIAYVQPCPEPLYFDSIHKVCKQKKDAVCGVRPFSQHRTLIDRKINNDNLIQPLNDEENNGRQIFNNLDPSTCIGTCPEEDPEFAVLLPNDDCKKFCMCSNGIAYVQPCPEPLYFDSIHKVCKQKKDAVCGVRPFSQSRTFMIDGKVDENNLIHSLNGDEHKT